MFFVHITYTFLNGCYTELVDIVWIEYTYCRGLHLSVVFLAHPGPSRSLSDPVDTSPRRPQDRRKMFINRQFSSGANLQSYNNAQVSIERMNALRFLLR